MGKFKRGWQLTKESWAIVRNDRSLVVFPIISAVAGIVTIAIFFALGAGAVTASDAEWTAIPFAVAGLYLLIVVGVFSSVALAACASRALEGHDTTVGEGIAAARGKLGLILAWSGVSLFVGTLIAVLQALLEEVAGSLVSSIIGGLANVGWSVATFFVVPVIALEGLTPKAALKRSVGVVKGHWGEGVVGTGAIGLIFLVAFLPAVLLMFAGYSVFKSSAPAGVALIAVGVIILAVGMLLQMTVTTVFKVALLRFATDGLVLGGFQQEQLESAFKPKKSKKR